MDVLVFKTNLTRQHLDSVTDALASVRGLTRWSVDLEDCDRVLRIEGRDLPSKAVIERLNRVKIACEELQ